jgi:hypothetical protein
MGEVNKNAELDNTDKNLHISDVLFSVSQPCTKYWVDLAMKIVSKDIRLPKCVRDGLVKKH